MKLGPQPVDVPREFTARRLGETLRIRSLATAFAALGLLWTSGCGFQPVYGNAARHYQVAPGRSSTASFEAMQSALDGVRSELGAGQALGAGPTVTVEILRIDERSLGVRAVGSDGVLARGAEITVVGRALVVDRPGSAAQLDTGDMSRAAQYAAGSSPAADGFARSRAVRDAARSLGRALGRAVLGLPEPPEG